MCLMIIIIYYNSSANITPINDNYYNPYSALLLIIPSVHLCYNNVLS